MAKVKVEKVDPFKDLKDEFENLFIDESIKIIDWKVVNFLKKHNFSTDEIVFLSKYCSAPKHHRRTLLDSKVIDISFDLYHHAEKFEFVDLVNDNFDVFKKYVACVLNAKYGGCKLYKIDNINLTSNGELTYIVSAKAAA